jgi:hypothetical protein
MRENLLLQRKIEAFFKYKLTTYPDQNHRKHLGIPKKKVTLKHGKVFLSRQFHDDHVIDFCRLLALSLVIVSV